MSSMQLLRIDEVDTVTGWIERGVNVEVVGSRVSGKTSLLSLVEDGLVASGWTTVRITGISALRDQPLEALALAGMIERRKPGESVASIVDQLAARWESSRVALVIDDIEFLDRISFGVIDALARRISIGLVSTGPLRPADPSLRPVFRLRHPCAELSLQPWSFAATNALLTSRFDQVVDPWLAGRIHRLSGGVPGFTLALLEAAEIESRLVLADSIWRHPENALWYPGLPRVIEDYIGPLPPEERSALEQLAAQGPVEFGDAAAAIGPEVLRRLEAHALVSVASADGRVHIVVSPPLVAEYLNWHQGTVQRIANSERFDSDESALVLETEVPDQDHVALGQLLTAHRAVDGERLADRWRADRSAKTAQHYIAWLVGSDKTRVQIDHVVETTNWSDGHSSDRAIALLDLARWEAIAGAGYDAAIKMLADGRASLDELAPMADHLALQLQVIYAEAPDYVEALVPIEPDAPDMVVVSAWATRTFIALTTGHFAEAEAASEAMGAHPTRPRTVMARSLALSARGRLQEAVDVATRGLNSAKNTFDAEGIHLCSYAAAFSMGLMGRRREAQEILGLSLPLGCPRPDLETTYLAELFVAARLAIQEAEFGRAETFGQQARSMRLDDGPTPGSSDLIAEVVTGLVVPSGSEQVIPKQTWARVERMWNRRHRLAAITAGLLLAETVPDLKIAQTVADWVAEVGEPSLKPSTDYVLGLALRDPEALAACAEGLERTGRITRAAVALAFAEDWFRSAARPELADRARSAAASLQTRFPEFELDLSLQRLPALRLSDREREIVALVSRGLSNKQIAEELVLSVRTVENHIYRAFRKTRMTSRGQLGALSD